MRDADFGSGCIVMVVVKGGGGVGGVNGYNACNG